jgi:hypothetical protein
MTISGPDVAIAVAEYVRGLVHNLPEFDAEWVAEYEAQREARQLANNSRLKPLEAEIIAETRKLENLFGVLEHLGVSDATADRIRQTEQRIVELKDTIATVKKSTNEIPELPTMNEIQAVADASFCNLAIEDANFARLMRSMIDEFYVLPYRLADGGHIQPRVCFRVALFSLLGSSHGRDLPIQQLEGIIDLVKNPKRVEILNDVVTMVQQGMKHADIAEQLGVFKTEVGYAMRLHRRMFELGTDDPWIPVTSAAQAADYFKRIRNPRFEFKPFPGFETTRHPNR